MKKYIAIFMSLAVCGVAYAGSMFDGMSKEELSNYEITITDKRTGKVVGKMSRSEYKVVRIGSEYELSADVKLTASKLVKEIQDNREVVRKYKEGYNTVIVHAGVGNDGLDVDHTQGGSYEVYEKRRAVGGVTGCRSVEGKGVCASAFTNETYTLGVKFDF